MPPIHFAVDNANAEGVGANGIAALIAYSGLLLFDGVLEMCDSQRRLRDY